MGITSQERKVHQPDTKDMNEIMTETQKDMKKEVPVASLSFIWFLYFHWRFLSLPNIRNEKESKDREHRKTKENQR